MTNFWANRICILVTMFAFYAIGYAGGREQTLQNYQNQTVCNSNLKP